MNMNSVLVFCATLIALFSVCLPSAYAAEFLKPWPSSPALGIPLPWKAQYSPDIEEHTQFRLITQNGKTVLQVDADMASGSLVHPFTQPVRLSSLSWQWQVLTQPTRADLKMKTGDDVAAKLCAFIQIDEGKLGLGTRLALAMARSTSGERLPAATLCYVWGAPGSEVGQVINNPFTDRVKSIVVRDAPSAGELIAENRDLQSDARKAFGNELPAGAVMFTGIALGANSDNTRSQAKAVFGDISAESE